MPLLETASGRLSGLGRKRKGAGGKLAGKAAPVSTGLNTGVDELGNVLASTKADVPAGGQRPLPTTPTQGEQVGANSQTTQRQPGEIGVAIQKAPVSGGGPNLDANIDYGSGWGNLIFQSPFGQRMIDEQIGGGNQTIEFVEPNLSSEQQAAFDSATRGSNEFGDPHETIRRLRGLPTRTSDRFPDLAQPPPPPATIDPINFAPPGGTPEPGTPFLWDPNATPGLYEGGTSPTKKKKSGTANLLSKLG